jgi:hypothetical protein
MRQGNSDRPKRLHCTADQCSHRILSKAMRKAIFSVGLDSTQTVFFFGPGEGLNSNAFLVSRGET